MSYEYTSEQQRAISSVDHSTVVVAGAGSGKTRVLVGRYLELLTKRLADISEIVAITFTDKAAAEMNERIRAALEERLNSCGAEDREYFESLVARQSEAVICTIDSLCKRIVGEYPLEAHVSPSFEIMDKLDVIRRKKAAARWAVERSLEDEDNITQIFIERDSFKNLVSGLTKIYEDMRITGVSIENMSVTEVEEIAVSPYIENEEKKLPHYLASAHILKLVKLMHQEYVNLGANGSRLDFVELEQALLRLLRDDKIGDTIRSRIKYVMVDEYQDINDIQDEIVKLLAKDEYARKLFIVGDPKQSIYRFRGGNLELFNEMAEEIAGFSEGIINLDTNFRSKASIIDATNHLFKNMFGESFTASKAGKEEIDSDPLVELVIINSQKSSEETAYNEALYIAKRIRDLRESSSSNIAYSDIAILMRSMNNVDLFAKAFDKFDIPYEIANTAGLYSAPEIVLMLNLLISITDESDDMALAATLRSILFNLDDTDILKIRLKAGDTSLYSALMKYDVSSEDGGKIARAQEILSQLSSEVDTTEPFEMIMRAANRTGVEAKFALYPDREKRLSNLRKFLGIAMNMARRYSIYDLVDCFRELAQEDDSEAEVSLSSDAVKLMTVHKSKGLEFPVVFLPQISKPIPPVRKFGLFDKDLGLWARVRNGFLEEDDFAQKIKEKNEERELAEHVRCLYVALTRACDKLIMVGTDNFDVEGDKKENKRDKTSWKHLISEALDLSFDWLGERTYNIGENSQLFVNIFEDELLANLEGEAETKEFEEALASSAEFPLLKPIVPNENRRITLPVSGLLTYAQCRRKYVYRHLLKIQPDFLPKPFSAQFAMGKGLSAVEIGDVFHAVCRRLDDPNDAREILLEEIEKFGSKYPQDDLENLLPLVEKFIEHYLSQTSEKNVFKEEPFLLKVGHLTISGVIDRLQITDDNRAIITDFKTDRVDRNQVAGRALDYQMQMDCYAVAVTSKFKCKQITTKLHFMRPDEVFERTFTEDDISEIKLKLLTSTEGIDKIDLKTAFYEEKPLCEKCVYAVLCGRTSKEVEEEVF